MAHGRTNVIVFAITKCITNELSNFNTLRGKYVGRTIVIVVIVRVSLDRGGIRVEAV